MKNAAKLITYPWILPISAALTALPLLFPKAGVLGFVSMIPALLFLFCRVEEGQTRVRRFYRYGFFYFFPFYLVNYYWFLALYPMSFAGITKGQAALTVALCWVGLTLLHAVISACLFPLFAALCRTAPVKKFPLMMPFLFSGLYAVLEWCLTHTFVGVPWARLALGQIEMPFLPNSAALFGIYFITFCLCLFNGLIAFLLLHPAGRHTTAILAAGVVVFHTVCGVIGYCTADVGKGNSMVIAAVQGNVGSAEKWNAEYTQRTKEVYESYTAKAADAGADMVVFPETFLPFYMDEGTPLREYICGLATTYGITIRCGAFAAGENGEEYNAVFTVYPDGRVDDTVYKKRKLVPFGEYVPFRRVAEVVVPVFADIGMLTEDLTPGKGSELVDTKWGKIGTLICFDSIYEVLTLQSVRDGANVIILPTNDSWFTDSAAAYMHNNQARYRAIESNRYFVRAADTGITDIITPRGRTEGVLAPMTEGMTVGTVYLNTGRTLYSYIGNLFVYLLIAALAALPLWQLWHTIKEKKKEKTPHAA